MDNCYHVKKYVFQLSLQVNIRNDSVVLSTTKYILHLLEQLCITKIYREIPKIHSEGNILLLKKKKCISVFGDWNWKKNTLMLRMNALQTPMPPHIHVHTQSIPQQGAANTIKWETLWMGGAQIFKQYKGRRCQFFECENKWCLWHPQNGKKCISGSLMWQKLWMTFYRIAFN